MKKVFYSLVFFASCISLFSSCSSADYNPNPSSKLSNTFVSGSLNSNYFNWGFNGSLTGSFTANIDGVGWVADPSSVNYSISGTYLIINGNQSGKKAISLSLANTYADNVYQMGYQNTGQYFLFEDSLNTSAANMFWSYNGIKNSGGIYVIQNDTAYFKAMFFGECVNAEGGIVNVSNGVIIMHR